jgi:hypothetical protein
MPLLVRAKKLDHSSHTSWYDGNFIAMRIHIVYSKNLLKEPISLYVLPGPLITHVFFFSPSIERMSRYRNYNALMCITINRHAITADIEARAKLW